jgi:hypothetical protein
MNKISLATFKSTYLDNWYNHNLQTEVPTVSYFKYFFLFVKLYIPFHMPPQNKLLLTNIYDLLLDNQCGQKCNLKSQGQGPYPETFSNLQQ